MFVNFYYDIFPESKKILGDLNVRLHYLATWWDILAVVKKGGYLERRADRRSGELPARAGASGRRRMAASPPSRAEMSLRVITLNVNGIRSAANKGLFRWLAAQRADVVCLQEMKCQEADLDAKLHGLKVYQTCHAFAEKKGYSGVALYTRKTPGRGAAAASRSASSTPRAATSRRASASCG